MNPLAESVLMGAGMSISNRGKLRRKMVLPVTVIRDTGEKQLAHTLDVTEISARLGGINMTLDPGEVIEIQRGGVKAKFHVYWTGEPGTELEGQAGVRGLVPNKTIWSTQLPSDEPDIALDVLHARSGASAQKNFAARSTEQRPALRYEYSGGVNLRAPGSNYPFRAQLKNIHVGGLYVETITTLPLNTVVSIEMQVEGILMETAGMVTGSINRVGMEIRFHKASPETRRKIIAALQKLKHRAWDAQPVPDLPHNPVTATAPASAPALDSADAGRALVMICKMLIAEIEQWKSSRTAAEVEELRKILAELQERLAPPAKVDLCEYAMASQNANHGA